MQYGLTDNTDSRLIQLQNNASSDSVASISGMESSNTVTPYYPPNAISPRLKLLQRQESVILAETGERVRRAISYNSEIWDESETLGDTYGPLSTLHQIYTNDIFRNVLKCSVAYGLASLGVYWTPFDNLLGNTDSKHVIATVVVYFHPSRSKGSMHQSLIFVCISLIFSFTVSFGCRSISAYFFKIGQDEISYSIDLIASSIALGIIAFVKQKVNKQTFNTACSLASISIVTCIVKEGSLNASNIPFERLKSTFQVVVIGCLITVVICYLIWPISAITQLENYLDESFDIMSSVLTVVTKRFLCGENFNSKDEIIFDQLKSNIKKLNSSLEEAYFELRLKGKEASLEAYEQLVESTSSLSKHLQALRSSTEMQSKLLSYAKQYSDVTPSMPSSPASNITSDIMSGASFSNLAEGDLSTEDSIILKSKNSEELFNLFVYYLAPSIKSLTFTIKEVLGKVPFEIEENRLEVSKHFQSSLVQASDLFNKSQTEAFELLYSQKVFKEKKDILFKTNQEEVTACCGNFSSLLGLFAVELIDFLKLLDAFEKAKDSPRKWSFLKFWNNEKEITDEDDQASFSNILTTLQSRYKPNKNIEHNTLQYRTWKFFTIFKRTDVQFGIRVGLGAFFLSLFAFLPYTRQTFNNWRGEWALAIYCIMNNKSLGGTSMTVKWRLIGTFMGAFSAYLVWISTNGNVYALFLTGFLFSILSFYIIIYWKANNAFGRFILLTYNLTALYSYSMTQKDGEDGREGGENPIIEEIAFHRFVAVSIGIIWALVMSMVFLQNSARSRLKKGLSILWLRLGISWSTDLLEYDESGDFIGIKDEKGMYYLLSECDTLLKQAPLEIRIKGKFPTSTYAELLKRTSSIIDSIQNLKLMIDLDPSISPNEKYVLQYIEAERKEVEHRIFLMFYMVASAMTLRFPVPDVLTSTEQAKSRMLIKLNEIRLQGSKTIQLKNEDYVLLYSYILVINEVSDQLVTIIKMVKDLLGDLSEEVFELV